MLFDQQSIITTLINLYDSIFFFFNDTATTEIYTLSLHDALPISGVTAPPWLMGGETFTDGVTVLGVPTLTSDRKSTRLNSSHLGISYAVFCLKKKNDGLKLHVAVRELHRPAI